MAEVFKAKAFGEEGFAKTIAIKRILPNMAEDQDFINMFIDEANILVKMNHANICQIYELGKILSSYYIEMEFIPGKDLLKLNNYFKKRKTFMPVEMAAYILSRVCRGLDYAHRKRDENFQALGLVHRDISPQNILVSTNGEIKIIDFGIAKAASRSTRTQVGVLKGKFGYMSPEQVRGLPVDHRSDLFAAGTVLFEILTAKRLFVADTDFATLEKVRKVDIPDPRTLRPDLPESMVRIVLKALARDREDRYQWGSEFEEDLERFQNNEIDRWSPLEVSEWMATAYAEEHAAERSRDEFFATIRSPNDLKLLDEYSHGGPEDTDDPDDGATIIYARSEHGESEKSNPPPSEPPTPLSPDEEATHHVAAIETEDLPPEPADKNDFDNRTMHLDGDEVEVLSLDADASKQAIPAAQSKPTTGPPATPTPPTYGTPPETHRSQDQASADSPFKSGISSSAGTPMGSPEPALSRSASEPDEEERTPSTGRQSMEMGTPSLPDSESGTAPALTSPAARAPLVRDILLGVCVAALILGGGLLGWWGLISDDLPEVAPGEAALIVRTSPSEDIRVKVDGILMGSRSPTIIEGLKPGAHSVIVAAEGFSVYRAQLELPDGQVAEHKVMLIPALKEQDPMLDAQPKNVSKTRAPAEPTKPPKEVPSKPPTPGKKKPKPSVAAAKPKPPARASGTGYLIVSAGLDIFARVFIDGEDSGRKTPISSFNKLAVPAGAHTLGLKLGDTLHEQNIVIEKGKTQRIRIRLRRNR